MAKKGKQKTTKKPTARKPGGKKSAGAKAKKKRAQHAPRPPFTDSDLKDKFGDRITDFAAYYAENSKDEQEPFEVYALPPSLKTLPGFIRLRCDDSEDCPAQVKADTLWPRFVELAAGTAVEVRGFPVGATGTKYVVVDSDPEGETFTVNKPGAKPEEAEVVGMHDVRRLPRKTGNPAHYSKRGDNHTKGHPDYFFSPMYRNNQYAKRKRERGIETGAIPLKSKMGAKKYRNHKEVKRTKEWKKRNPTKIKAHRDNAKPKCPHCGAKKYLSDCDCGGLGTGLRQLANVMRRTLRLAIDADVGKLDDKAAKYLTGLVLCPSSFNFRASRGRHGPAPRGPGPGRRARRPCRVTAGF